ncbi:NAD(P)/FAD-dependent oxidoreductase [Bacillus alveayuensis]|uniref:NAD(P)/FAD-dependent oxidoreductase n=1 Tax=Aeribacillus alveayuensis TaxID=279215 RepID=UPI000A5E64B9|nr:NAD(P)/FAD-dependent oxidoreductase [Bacillus alveayuensis]
MIYDCIIIGGGIAGLQAAIQLGRYQHDVLVIDSHSGRSTICRQYHNILGWPDGVSGNTLRTLGKQQAEQYGVMFVNDEVINIHKHHPFRLETKTEHVYFAHHLIFSTGVVDRIPEDLKEIIPCLGKSIYICPDCDGYEVLNKKVFIIGSGKSGATLAITLKYWTNDITYINHERIPLDEELQNSLQQNFIRYIPKKIKRVLAKKGQFKGIELTDGETHFANHAFIAFGNNKVQSELAKNLGVSLNGNNHIIVNPRTKESNVQNVFAAGDVVAHSEQVAIAMGDGSQAAIWVHKRIMDHHSR